MTGGYIRLWDDHLFHLLAMCTHIVATGLMNSSAQQFSVFDQYWMSLIIPENVLSSMGEGSYLHNFGWSLQLQPPTWLSATCTREATHPTAWLVSTTLGWASFSPAMCTHVAATDLVRWPTRERHLHWHNRGLWSWLRLRAHVLDCTCHSISCAHEATTLQWISACTDLSTLTVPLWDSWFQLWSHSLTVISHGLLSVSTTD